MIVSSSSSHTFHIHLWVVWPCPWLTEKERSFSFFCSRATSWLFYQTSRPSRHLTSHRGFPSRSQQTSFGHDDDQSKLSSHGHFLKMPFSPPWLHQVCWHQNPCLHTQLSAHVMRSNALESKRCEPSHHEAAAPAKGQQNATDNVPRKSAPAAAAADAAGHLGSPKKGGIFIHIHRIRCIFLCFFRFFGLSKW